MTAMDFYDAAKFFPDYSGQEKVLVYSILGGIPHYLKQFDSKKPLADNIKQNMFGKTTVRDTTSKTGLQMAKTEIDLVAVSRQNREYLIGEYKYRIQPFRYSEYLDARTKLTPQKENVEFYYALFSESEFDEKIQEMIKQDDHLLLFPLEMIINYGED